MNNKTQKEPSKKNSNWGKGLVIAIVLFVCSTLGVVAYLVSLDYYMVTDHHYEKAVQYQQHIDRVKETKALKQPVEVSLINRQLRIQFPSSFNKSDLTGTVELYRPSNPALDQTVAITLSDEGVQQFNMNEKPRGKWLVKINWSANGKKYYKQKAIFL